MKVISIFFNLCSYKPNQEFFIQLKESESPANVDDLMKVKLYRSGMLETNFDVWILFLFIYSYQHFLSSWSVCFRTPTSTLSHWIFNMSLMHPMKPNIFWPSVFKVLLTNLILGNLHWLIKERILLELFWNGQLTFQIKIVKGTFFYLYWSWKIKFYVEEQSILKDMRNFLNAVKTVRLSQTTWCYQ